MKLSCVEEGREDQDWSGGQVVPDEATYRIYIANSRNTPILLHVNLPFPFDVQHNSYAAMIDSIYILDRASAALILQHTYTGQPPPTEILEYFQSLLLNDPHSPPASILAVPSSVVPIPTVLFHTTSSNNNIILLSPLMHEPHDAVGVIELLDRIAMVLEDYFGKEKLGRGIVEGNFDVVEELLGEMVDSGEIMTTEPNALRDIVLPPSLLNKFMSAAGLQG